jgi:hypothetical protein
MEDTGTRTRTQLKMKVLRCYGTPTSSVLYTRGLELSALPDGDMLDRLAKHDSRGVTSPSREGLLCFHTGRGQRRSGDPVEGRMKDRSGDEVSNSAGSVVAARQPRLGLLHMETKPGQAGFCPVLHVILIAPTILFYPIRHPLLLSWSWGTINNLKPDRD